MKGYRVLLEPIEDGWWMATVPAVQGCRTDGKSLAVVKRRVRQALALFVGDEKAKVAPLEFDVQLPKDFRQELEQYKSESERLRQTQEQVRNRARRLVKAARDLHLTLREAAELLGVSFQRIGQLTGR